MSGNQKIIVVGANAAGLKAAARAKRLLPDWSITVFEQGTYIAYGACGMPYFVSGDIDQGDELRKTSYGVLEDEDFFRAAKGLEVVTQTVVESIDREAKRVFCRSLISGETSEHHYDKLVLATGSIPVMPAGVPRGSKCVSTFKTFEDGLAMRQALQEGSVEKICLVGAGPTGCELAEAVSAMWGTETTLIDAAPTILSGMLDPEMARPIETYLKSEDVEIITDCALQEIIETDDGVVVKTSCGDIQACHAVIAIGVRPNSRLASECGLETGQHGGIVVDENMATSDPNIFAAGDCVESTHLLTGRPYYLPLGSMANLQARVVGSNLAGKGERFGPVAGSTAVKVFDMNIASTGLTERAARDAGFDAGVSWGSATDLAYYYPGKQNLHLKLIYDRTTGKLLGLHGYTRGEVVKRIDVFTALLKHGGTLEDLLDTEYAYSPPYAPPTDTLYIAACAARDEILEGVEAVSPDTRIDEALVVDVRRAQEAADWPLHEKDQMIIPFETFRDHCTEVPHERPVICACSKGIRSSEAVRILKQQGCPDVKYIGGGTLIKQAQGLE